MQIFDQFLIFISHSYVQAIAVIIVTFLFIFLARKIMYFLVEKYIKNKTIKNKIIPLLEKPIFYTVTTRGFLIALALLPLDDAVIKIGNAILNTLLLVIWGMFFLKFSKFLIHIASKNKKVKVIKPQTVPLFDNFFHAVIIIILLFNVFSLWGINMSAWLASAGILGLAIGMAAKDTLANFLSGILILADSPYKIGDYLILESGERGKVTQIGIRSTRIVTRDDVEVTIPNSIMENSRIKNESGGNCIKTRVRINIGVAYGTDLDEVEKVLLDIADENELIISDPMPRVRWNNFGASSIDCQLKGWISDPETKGKVSHQLIKKIYTAFQKHNIEIPYNKQELFIKQVKE